MRWKSLVSKIKFLKSWMGGEILVVGEGNLLHLGEGDFSVDEHAPVGNDSAGVVLAALDHNVIETVLGNREVPLDPLAVASPGISSDVVEDRVGDGVGNRGR